MTGITGGGKLIWDDSEEAFSMSKGLRVTAGSVAIGSTSAMVGADLDIYSTSATMLNIWTNSDAAGAYSVLRLKTVSGGGGGYAKAGIFFEGDGAGGGRGDLHLAVNGTADGSNVALADARLTIRQDGNVGIGTTAPDAVLELRAVTSGAGGHPPLYLRRQATNESASLKLKTTTTDDWIVGMRNDGTSNFRIYSYGASSDVFSILR